MVRFDISDLRIFVNVVQAGSITRGADLCHRAVASISARIKEMEQEMGAPLLTRSRGGVVPTEAGRKLLGHAHRLLNEVQQMNDDLAEYGHRAKGFVKLYCNTVSLYDFLQRPIGQYLLKYPSTTLTIEEMVNDQIPQAVVNGRADIGVVAEPVDTHDLETFPFTMDRYVAIASSAWPRPSGSRFADFLDHELVGPGRGTWMHTMLQEHAAEQGKVLRNSVQLRSFSMACELVADGVGIGIVPASTARRMSQTLGLHIIELEDAWATLPLTLCVRRRSELTANSAELLTYLASVGPALGPKVRADAR